MGVLQAFLRVSFLDTGAHSVHHILEIRAAVQSRSLGVRFLEEPKLLKGNNGVSTSNFQVELGHVSFRGRNSVLEDSRSAPAPLDRRYPIFVNETSPTGQQS